MQKITIKKILKKKNKIKIKDLKKDENYLQKTLEDGSSKASKIATKNLKEIKFNW